jgi:hypothetical protein
MSETVNEQVIETPNYRMTSRQTKRCHEVRRAESKTGLMQGPPSTHRSNDNFHQINESTLPTFTLNASNSLQIPPELQQILNMSNRFQIQVSYNISGQFQGPQVAHMRNVLRGGLMQDERFPLALNHTQSMDTTSNHKYLKQERESIMVESSSDESTVIEKTKILNSDDEMYLKAEVKMKEKPVTDSENNKASSVPSKLKSQKPLNKTNAGTSQKIPKIAVKEIVKPQSKPVSVNVKNKLVKKDEKKKPEKVIAKNQKTKLQKDHKSNIKRHAPLPTKTRETSKKVRTRASISPQISSEDDEEMQSTVRKGKLEVPPPITTSQQAKTYSEVTKQSFQTHSDLTLDDISCGSSCSTVTSDDDKNYNPKKFNVLRTKKKLEHRHQKLMIRTGMNSAFSESKLEVTKCKPTVKETKKEELNDSSSPYTSDDDFLAPALRIKNAEKKARWEAKLAARQNKMMPPPPQPPKQLASKSAILNQNTTFVGKKVKENKKLGKENQADVIKPRYFSIIDSDSD